VALQPELDSTKVVQKVRNMTQKDNEYQKKNSGKKEICALEKRWTIDR